MHPFILLLAAARPLAAPAARRRHHRHRLPRAGRDATRRRLPPQCSTQDEIEALGLPLASDVLRLAPGVAVAVSGPAGSQTQVRIRGAEANHSLLFVDGIRFNDPAAGNEPRFELLTSDGLVADRSGPRPAIGAVGIGGDRRRGRARARADRARAARARAPRRIWQPRQHARVCRAIRRQRGNARPCPARPAGSRATASTSSAAAATATDSRIVPASLKAIVQPDPDDRARRRRPLDRRQERI